MKRLKESARSNGSGAFFSAKFRTWDGISCFFCSGKDYPRTRKADFAYAASRYAPSFHHTY